MPVYGKAQAGYNGSPNQGLNLSAVGPGEQIVLFDGTEAVANGLASVAFALGYNPGGDGSKTVNCQGMSASTTIDLQCAATDVDGDYNSVVTLSPDASGNASWTDPGLSPFYRVKISAYSTGTMPIVKVSR